MPPPDPKFVIIKKVKKVSGGGHHGGAWKIAYADFVTAMMAFFMLLWLLSLTTVDQKQGIANYFSPVGVMQNSGGSSGVLDKGSSTQPKGELDSLSNEMQVFPQIGPTEQTDSEEKGEGSAANAEKNKSSEAKLDQAYNISKEKNKTEDDEKGKAEIKKEQQMMQDMAEKLKKSIDSIPALQQFKDNVLIDMTDEGLRIQIIDREPNPMFKPGSSDMYPQAKELLEKITQVILEKENKISISGHTDSSPFSKGGKNNWDLSSDRAQVSRRVMMSAGLPSERIFSVIGKEDNEHLLPDKPFDPINRRISIVLLRKFKIQTDKKK